MLKVALFAGLTLIAGADLAHAQVATSCSDAYRNCMGGRGNRDNSPNKGAQCQRTKDSCMRTGNWQNQFQQLTGLKRQ